MSRTCEDAGIPLNFCTCGQNYSILQYSDTLVKSLGTFAVNQLNLALANVSNICRPLALLNVTEAKVKYTCSNLPSKRREWNLGFLNALLEFSLGYDADDCVQGGRYELLFHTLPGNGLLSTRQRVDYSKV